MARSRSSYSFSRIRRKHYWAWWGGTNNKSGGTSLLILSLCISLALLSSSSSHNVVVHAASSLTTTTIRTKSSRWSRLLQLGPPVRNNNDIDGTVNGCMNALVASDLNGDAKVKKQEYLSFYNQIAGYKCVDPKPEIDLELQTAFVTIACMCREREGFNEDCCFGTSASIETSHAVNPTQRTEEEEVYLKAVCLITETIVGPDMCAIPPVSPAPGEAVVVVAPQIVEPEPRAGPTEDRSLATILSIIGLLLLLLLCCCCCYLARKREPKAVEDGYIAGTVQNKDGAAGDGDVERGAGGAGGGAGAGAGASGGEEYEQTVVEKTIVEKTIIEDKYADGSNYGTGTGDGVERTVVEKRRTTIQEDQYPNGYCAGGGNIRTGTGSGSIVQDYEKESGWVFVEVQHVWENPPPSTQGPPQYYEEEEEREKETVTVEVLHVWDGKKGGPKGKKGPRESGPDSMQVGTGPGPDPGPADVMKVPRDGEAPTRGGASGPAQQPPPPPSSERTFTGYEEQEKTKEMEHMMVEVVHILDQELPKKPMTPPPPPPPPPPPKKKKFDGIPPPPPPPPPPGPLRPIEVIKKEPVQVAYPERNIYEDKFKDDDSAQKLDHYIPEGGVPSPSSTSKSSRSVKVPWDRLPPKQQKVIEKKQRTQHGFGDGEVWDILDNFDKQQEKNKADKDHFTWVVRSSLDILWAAEDRGDLNDKDVDQDD